MKRTKTFKAFDRSHLNAQVATWLASTKPAPKIVGTDESITIGPVRPGAKKKVSMIQLKVRYE